MRRDTSTAQRAQSVSETGCHRLRQNFLGRVPEGLMCAIRWYCDSAAESHVLIAPYVCVGLQVTGHPEEHMSGSRPREGDHRRRNVTSDSPAAWILAATQSPRAGACALVCMKCGS